MSKKKKKYNDYSTNPEWEYDDNPFADILTQGNSNVLHVQYERKGHGGKEVTKVYGWDGSEDELNQLCSTLKKKLGTGGSVRSMEILIQGKKVDKVKKILEKEGYKTK